MTVGSEVALAVKHKYDILKTEVLLLKENIRRTERQISDTVDAKEKAEADVAAMKRRIMLIEEDFEQSNSRLTETTTKLEEASQLAESSERNTGKLLCLDNARSEELDDLDRKLLHAQNEIDNNERTYEEISRRIQDVTGQYTDKFSELEKRESQIKTLETTLFAMASKMKFLEAEQYQIAEKESIVDQRIRQLRSQLMDAEHRVRVQEAEAARRNVEIKSMEELVVVERSRYEELRNQVDKMVDEF